MVCYRFYLTAVPIALNRLREVPVTDVMVNPPRTRRRCRGAALTRGVCGVRHVWRCYKTYPVPGRGYVFRNNRHQERADIITYRMTRYVKNYVTDTAAFWRTDGKKISVPVPQPDGGTDEPATGTCCRRATQNVVAWRGSDRN